MGLTSGLVSISFPRRRVQSERYTRTTGWCRVSADRRHFPFDSFRTSYKRKYIFKYRVKRNERPLTLSFDLLVVKQQGNHLLRF